MRRCWSRPPSKPHTISATHRCVFVHIPKTGGSSIEAVIWPGPRTEADLWMGFVSPMRNKYQTGGLQHLCAHQIRTEVGDDRFNAYFKFAVVRNPWDKAVSQYAFMRERLDLRSFIGMADGASFADYLKLIARVEHVQSMRQLDFLLGSDGRMLVDFIARFETLAVDLTRVFARLGIDCPRLPVTNRSKREVDYRLYYDDASRAAVARMYEADIAYSGYEF